MTIETVSTNRSFGGTQGVYKHSSRETGTPMVFSVFVPDHAPGAKLPVVWYLSGLTCTHANVTEKGEFRRACAELGLIFVAPDTSPRGDDVPDDEAYDFGKGAGFYVDATAAPWAANFRMRSYIENELPEVIGAHFPVDMARQGIMGHSMGGHGALTISLRNPGRFRATSAFAPIVSPLHCPWGEKALGGYLGADRAAWREYDACALIEDGARVPELLVDQGGSDNFLKEQLKPELLEAACAKAGITLTLGLREGYDHSYYFISTFMEAHLRWHHERLNR
ncbi:S-formylglutathione hydrolase [Sphingosinicella sp.]|uniref:S-formylglutathione hydrolase n=1 Tax=Sphingosinicella sp. TaxID=1917971 RepID=UPI0035B47925